MNVSNFDVRLLVVFDALMLERNVTRAAARLSMSQPAVSNAMQRLRVLIGDQLFLKTAKGVEPTPRAREMATPVSEAIKLFQSALMVGSGGQDPAKPIFKIAFSEPTSVVVLPILVKNFSSSWKKVSLEALPKVNSELEKQLDTGEADLVVGAIPPLPKRFQRAALFQDVNVCVMRKDHPLKRITAKNFSTIGQISVAPNSKLFRGLDAQLQSFGSARKITLSVSQYHAVQPILLSSDLITCVPNSVASTFDPERVRIAPLPYPIGRHKIEMAWNSLRERDTEMRWLRSSVLTACEGLGI